MQVDSSATPAAPQQDRKRRDRAPPAAAAVVEYLAPAPAAEKRAKSTPAPVTAAEGAPTTAAQKRSESTAPPPSTAPSPGGPPLPASSSSSTGGGVASGGSRLTLAESATLAAALAPLLPPPEMPVEAQRSCFAASIQSKMDEHPTMRTLALRYAFHHPAARDEKTPTALLSLEGARSIVDNHGSASAQRVLDVSSSSGVGAAPPSSSSVDRKEDADGGNMALVLRGAGAIVAASGGGGNAVVVRSFDDLHGDQRVKLLGGNVTKAPEYFAEWARLVKSTAFGEEAAKGNWTKDVWAEDILRGTFTARLPGPAPGTTSLPLRIVCSKPFIYGPNDGTVSVNMAVAAASRPFAYGVKGGLHRMDDNRLWLPAATVIFNTDQNLKGEYGDSKPVSEYELQTALLRTDALDTLIRGIARDMLTSFFYSFIVAGAKDAPAVVVPTEPGEVLKVDTGVEGSKKRAPASEGGGAGKAKKPTVVFTGRGAERLAEVRNTWIKKRTDMDKIVQREGAMVTILADMALRTAEQDARLAEAKAAVEKATRGLETFDQPDNIRAHALEHAEACLAYTALPFLDMDGGDRCLLVSFKPVRKLVCPPKNEELALPSWFVAPEIYGDDFAAKYLAEAKALNASVDAASKAGTLKEGDIVRLYPVTPESSYLRVDERRDANGWRMSLAFSAQPLPAGLAKLPSGTRVGFLVRPKLNLVKASGELPFSLKLEVASRIIVSLPVEKAARSTVEDSREVVSAAFDTIE